MNKSVAPLSLSHFSLEYPELFQAYAKLACRISILHNENTIAIEEQCIALLALRKEEEIAEKNFVSERFANKLCSQRSKLSDYDAPVLAAAEAAMANLNVRKEEELAALRKALTMAKRCYCHSIAALKDLQQELGLTEIDNNQPDQLERQIEVFTSNAKEDIAGIERSISEALALHTKQAEYARTVLDLHRESVDKNRLALTKKATSQIAEIEAMAGTDCDRLREQRDRKIERLRLLLDMRNQERREWLDFFLRNVALVSEDGRHNSELVTMEVHRFSEQLRLAIDRLQLDLSIDCSNLLAFPT